VTTFYAPDGSTTTGVTLSTRRAVPVADGAIAADFTPEEIADLHALGFSAQPTVVSQPQAVETPLAEPLAVPDQTSRPAPAPMSQPTLVVDATPTAPVAPEPAPAPAVLA